MTNDTLLISQEHRKTFDSQVLVYDEFAVAQHIAARNMAHVLQTYQRELEGKSMMELGAGTGMVTDHLVRLFPDSNIVSTDISPNMIAMISEKYSKYDKLRFELHDANVAHLEMAMVQTIVSGFTLQWLDDAVASVSCWLEAMGKPGMVFLTWPGEGSFPEWRRASESAGLAFTGNILPGADIIDRISARTGADVDYHSVDDIVLEYPSAVDFFRSIRNIGAGIERDVVEGRRNLLRLARVWDGLSDGRIMATYKVHTAVLSTN